MTLVVQKFGGTSIGNAKRINSVVNIIKQNSEKFQIIVVVSAISNKLKSEGTTSLLIKLAEQAVSGYNYQKTIDEINHLHQNIIADLNLSQNYLELINEKLSLNLIHLSSFIKAISVIREISARSYDVILAFGEKLSALILSTALNNSGIESEYVNLEKIIDHEFKYVNIEFHEFARKALSKKLIPIMPKIPVITGFIGRVPQGILKSIGRGYTDFTAASIAASLSAKELQIWKEVDGVFSADPNKVKNAYIIESLSPAEAAEITYYGSEVIHPFTIEQVIQNKIPVRIKNILNPNSAGTVIDSNVNNENNLLKPTAITIKRNIQIINIKSNRMLMAHGFMAKVFDIFEKNRIIIDLIATSEVSISLTVDAFVELDYLIDNLSKIGEVTIYKDMAILSLVGHGMSKAIGTSGKMFQSLAKNSINIEMISQGASEINISCVINDENALNAIRIIHNEMLL